MNIEDETFLSAYLDDELDAPRRVEVEAALRSNPRLSGRLRELTEARDLVAGLGRPAAPAGLSDAILARLARRPAGLSGLASRARRLPSPFLLGAGASLAAGVVIAVSLTLSGRERRVEHEGLAKGPLLARVDPAAKRPDIPPKPIEPAERQHPDSPQELMFRDGATASSPAQPSPMGVASEPLHGDKQPADLPPPSSAPQVLARDVKREAAPPMAMDHIGEEALAVAGLGEVDPGKAELAALLGRPGVRLLMVVADVIDEKTIATFDDTVKEARPKRPRQFRCEIGQGVVLDADHPEGRGVIFAMAMDDSERKGLHEALAAKFSKDRVVEDIPPAAVTTQLARGELGKIELIDDEAAGRLLANHPRLENYQLAFKTEQNNSVDAPSIRKNPDDEPKLGQTRGIQGPEDAAKTGTVEAKDLRKGGEIANGRDKKGELGRRSATGAVGGSIAQDDRLFKSAKPAGQLPSVAAKAKEGDAVRQRAAPEPDTVLVWLTVRAAKK